MFSSYFVNTAGCTMSFCLIVVVLLSVSSFAVSTRYSGYSLIRLEPLIDMNQVDDVLPLREKFEDERYRQMIIFDDIILPRKRSLKILVSSDERLSVEQYLRDFNVKYTVINEDFGRLLDEYNELNEREKSQYVKSRGSMAPNYFMSYDDIEETLASWASKHSDVASTFSLGLTYEQRQTVGIAINDQRDDLPAIWIDGGIDPRVWLTTSSVLYVAYKIIHDSDDDTVKLRSMYRWYFLPTVNPDGYQHTLTQDRFWRKTRTPYEDCYGADLNRNFNITWAGAGTSPNPCHDRYRGPEPFSEAESRNLQKAFKKLNNSAGHFHVYINFQGHGQNILAPWSGRPMFKTEDHEYLMVVARDAIDAVASMEGVGAADEKFRFGTAPDIRYVIRGSVLDWVRGDVGVQWTFGIDVAPTDSDTQHPLGVCLPPTVIYAAGAQSLTLVTTMVRSIEAGPTVDLLQIYAGDILLEREREKADKRDEL